MSDSDPTSIARIAAELQEAERDRRPVDPPAGRYPHLRPDDAYAIARVNIDRRLAAGARIVGHKIGLTSPAMQEMLGVHEPDYGHLLDDMVVPDGGTVSVARFCEPRVEPEIAFRLSAELRGPGVEAADVLAATDAVAPALEIIDSRVADWRITWWDTVADNASSGAFVVGPWRPLGEAGDLESLDVELYLDDVVVETGSSSAVLGHPAVAVAWLANALAGHGSGLEAGSIVLSGSCTRAVDVRAGSRVRGVVTGLGSVSATFVESPDEQQRHE